MRLQLLLTALVGACRVQAAAVFAHFMVGNTAEYSDDTWRTDIRLAKEAHIDAFALNMAHGESVNEASLEKAFRAAGNEGFKLFFSFDYAGRGPWPKDTVVAYLKKYASRAEYFKHSDGKPLVSTFEGPGNAQDWIDIKKQVSCFFIPDWSSEGAEPALALAGGVADGLFNWAAWPWGAQDMDTYVDASYVHYLNKKPYMMPVSPWFYTNMPGYNKNWMWRGDDMWHNRWIQVVYNQPEYVQIISWNDYGESHHIGPLYDHAMEAFEVGKAPFNYATGRPHDGWRLTLPFWIDYYKTGKATVTQEGLVTWYRTSPSGACSNGGTVGNTASQLQLEFPPEQIMQDKLFFSAVLAAEAEVTVTVGGKVFYPTWSSTPDGGVGVYHGSVDVRGVTGDVSARLWRRGRAFAEIAGAAISAASCHNGLTNWNPWVGSATSRDPVSATTPRSRGEQGCIKGTGAPGFKELCEFNCQYDYCPVSSCLCQAVGAPRPKPAELQKSGYPAAGRSENYSGLCSNACNLGFCPPAYCSPTVQPLIVPTVSEFLPPACQKGVARAEYPGLGGLCSYACNFGFCPIHVCQCTVQGALTRPPPQKPGVTGKPSGGVNDENLCNFACSRGYCPDNCVLGSSDPAPDPADECRPSDNTFKAETMRTGSHYPWYLLDAESTSAKEYQYITIVNLTPYRFKYLKDSSNFHQIRADFDDIPPGHARQCVMEYAVSGASRVDDKGEAYYEVVGTARRFNIKARTHIPHQYPRRTIVDLDGWGLGAREYEDPDTQASVTFVITGSESYGYHHSMTWGSSDDNWMSSIRDSIKDRKLKHVVMPGTHDSGMSKIGKYKWGGTEANTRTQGGGIYTQLRAGARYFDLRPATVPADGGFHLFHVVDWDALVVLGASGVTLNEVVDDVNKFTSESPGEVIIFWLGNIAQYIGPSKGGHPINKEQTNELFAMLEKINNRCPDLGSSPKFGDRKMGEFMSKNNGRGCVLIMVDHVVAEGVAGDKTTEGIYRARNHLDFDNNWVEARSVEEVIGKQVEYFTKTNRRRINDNTGDVLTIAQFQLTPELTTSDRYGLEAIAVLPTNPALYYGAVPAMTPYYYPSVFMQDYFGVRLPKAHDWDSLGAEARVLALGLNLYMASENCEVSPGRNPLFKKSSKRRPAPWNGIIFANGTVMNTRPAHYDPWRNPVLRAGTVFGNGTVLTRNITNPFH
ncbi:mutanase [Colletotrichum higginsianum IMI 349063]|uniref:Mutanase n=1 Tax=Colletotrichum higginsianum (strain IMI 349063) TaxID=759273 RepID=A0A1B7YEG7_COLHI|nr:mutanase [Colletotrichum higginsianum IMI 349063]OBR10453.1 mutanase [Colletotrichum higginsianum IMI 349063]